MFQRHLILLRLTKAAYDPYVKVRAKTPKNTDASAIPKWPTEAAWRPEKRAAEPDAMTKISITPIRFESNLAAQKSTMAPGKMAIGIEK